MRRRSHAVFRRHDRRPYLVVHRDAVDGVGRAVGIVGDDHRDRLADVADDVARQHGGGERPALVRTLGAGQDRPRRLGKVGGGPHRGDARERPRLARVHLQDARVRVMAAHDADVEHAGAVHVVEIAARALEQAAVFHASRRAADEIAVLVHAAQCNRGGRWGKGRARGQAGSCWRDAS
jgi:hypothetical protein